MKNQRIYIDTSVFGGYIDDEFQEFTVPLFERMQKEEFIILFSDVTQEELEFAPEKVKKLVTGLKEDLTELNKTDDEVVELAAELLMST
ncbi:PIN domain-containing protein [Salinimicrobium xinjiangense]|uniref:hypothetical protein n=1 Tax=Salinimicrobium xinjiangense TaxID=438596 RepID=UPI000685E277|nr:hypothetical protein [Salinimicrobium xinjiangense]